MSIEIFPSKQIPPKEGKGFKIYLTNYYPYIIIKKT